MPPPTAKSAPHYDQLALLLYSHAPFTTWRGIIREAISVFERTILSQFVTLLDVSHFAEAGITASPGQSANPNRSTLNTRKNPQTCLNLSRRKQQDAL